ncbi:MAG: AIR synthase related protein [Candidatus Hodarchaeales archaeon]
MNDDQVLNEGKLPVHLLERILYYKGADNPGIISGPGIGRDAAVLDINRASKNVREFYSSSCDLYIVEKTDPVTFVTPDPGKSVIHVNANDIACTGAIPVFFSATIILPAGFSEKGLLGIQKSLSSTCRELDIAIIGGHTEISSGVNRPIIAGTMLGLVPSDYLIRGEVKPGDAIAIAGFAALEGTHILLEEAKDHLALDHNRQEIDNAAKISSRLSILDKAISINKKYKPAALHDPTEGGVMGALYEFIHGKNLDLSVEKTAVPVMSVTKDICGKLDINPLKLISSGSLLIADREDKLERIASEFSTKDFPINIIARVKEKTSSLPLPEPDHLIQGLLKLAKLKRKG